MDHISEAHRGFPAVEMLLQPCQGHKMGCRYSELFAVARDTLRRAALLMETSGATQSLGMPGACLVKEVLMYLEAPYA